MMIRFLLDVGVITLVCGVAGYFLSLLVDYFDEGL